MDRGGADDGSTLRVGANKLAGGYSWVKECLKGNLVKLDDRPGNVKIFLGKSIFYFFLGFLFE